MDSKIILVGGYCATGKSTFSHRLSKMLGLPCFNKDSLKEAVADGFGSGSEEVREKGSSATFGLMLHIAERFLQTGQACILEANFRRLETERIAILLAQYNAKCLTFAFTGDLDSIYDRYVTRDQSGTRHWVHLEAGNRSSFKSAHVQAGLGEIAIGQTVRVDAMAFEKIDYEALFALARKFMHGKNG